MTRLNIAPAASALLRALVARSGASRDRVLLTDAQSVDWRSLTFNGERHLLDLRIPGPDALQIVERMCTGLEDVEFSIPGIIVADVAVAGEMKQWLDGSISLAIEALTIEQD